MNKSDENIILQYLIRKRKSLQKIINVMKKFILEVKEYGRTGKH
jgi:hypothetical protein